MKPKLLSDGELMVSMRDAVQVLHNCIDAIAATTRPEFILPLLNEAMEASRVVNAAVVTLRDRAAGVKPPKLGD